jgi:hypothetical protein
MEKKDMTTEQTGPAPEQGEPEKKNAPPAPETPPSEDKGTVPYARFAEVNQQKKLAEETLKTVVAELVNDLPEAFRPLVPASLPPADKVAWIKKAKEAGLFSKPSAPELDTKRPSGKPPADLSKLSTHELLSSGYKT